jgi:hypothetical protein
MIPSPEHGSTQQSEASLALITNMAAQQSEASPEQLESH